MSGHVAISRDSLEQFRDFVSKARELSNDRDAANDVDIAQFELFVKRAQPLVTALAREYLKRFVPLAARLEPWLVSVDLLDIARCSMDEDRYTALLAWALTQDGSALACQNALLEAAGISTRIARPLTVTSWLRTEENTYPDLVLHDDQLLVVVEAKTLTQEHEAGQTGKMQTVAYLEASRAALQLPAHVAGHTVFLTVNGDAPQNPKAHPLTYAKLALAFADALEPDALPRDVRFAYSTLITNWVVQTSGFCNELAAALHKAKTWAEADDAQLLRELGTINKLQDRWPLEENDR